MSLAVAVLTLTRDRLDYTKHCFARLRENAGVDYDHYVLDQGSADGTVEWLTKQPAELTALDHNIGISRGMNHLLDQINPMNYDVIVKVDNDCELTMPNTLRDVARLAYSSDASLSPLILGLRNPPQPTRELQIGDETILDVPQIGGIFLAAPAHIYDEFRYADDNPYWGMDDVQVCAWHRANGGWCGYVKRLEAWHYQTTDGQHRLYPDYFARTLAEGKAAL